MRWILAGLAACMVCLAGCGGETPNPLDAEMDAGDLDTPVGLDALEDASVLADVLDGPEPEPDAPSCACDDGIACTLDRCEADGTCQHTARHVDCPTGQYCDSAMGCVAGGVCATVDDCDRVDPCLVVTCDPGTRLCLYDLLDGDSDGYVPLVCGGDDCDDGNGAVHPGVDDHCDGVDSDCSGGPDPVDAPGCSPFEQCVDGACACPSALTVCVGPSGERVCTDLTSDPRHCGDCLVECDAFGGQVCDEGLCGCPAGSTLCPASFGTECADLSSSHDHCGTCGNGCGEATCSSGACSCPAPATLCTNRFGERECADTSSDHRHCGTCGNACLDLSDCDGTCAFAGGDFLRAYGTTTSSVTWASDGTTSFAVTIVSGTQFHELPGGASLFTPASRTELLQFDGSGSFVRRYPTTAAVLAVSVAGDFAVAGLSFTGASASFGGLTIPTAGTSSSRTTALVALDVPTGTARLLRSFVLPSGALEQVLAHPDGTAHFSGYSSDTVDFGTGALPLGDRHYSYLVAVGTSGAPTAARRMPGGVVRLAADGAGGVIALSDRRSFTSPTADFTLGGAMLSRTAPGFAAHFDAAFVHQHSFELPTFSASWADAGGVLVAAIDTVRSYRFDGSGAIETVSPAGSFTGLSVASIARMGARVVMTGASPAAYTFGGRVSSPEMAWYRTHYVASFDAGSLEPMGFAHMYAEPRVLVPRTGTSAWLGGVYYHLASLGHLQVSAPSTRGLWLAELRMP